MLSSLLAMAGIDETELNRLKGELDNTLIRLKAADDKIEIISKQIAEMHAAFFQMVPRPAQPIQDGVLINDEQVEHVGEVVELNTPETAFTVN